MQAAIFSGTKKAEFYLFLAICVGISLDLAVS